MIASVRWVVAAGLSAFLLPGFAWAEPCASLTDGMPDGSVAPFFYDGGLGRAHPGCTRSELSLREDGLIVADSAAFYGHIVAGTTIDGRYALGSGLEIFGSVEAVRYEQVIGALSSSYLGLGHTSLGAAGVVYQEPDLLLGLNGKVVLPTAVGLYQNSWPVGVDFAVSGVWSHRPSVRVHGQVGVLGSAVASKAGAQPEAGLEGSLGVEWRPAKVFGLVLEADSGTGYHGTFDHLAFGIGLRTSIGPRFGLELGGVVPVAGAERALVSVGLRGAYRFGALRAASAPPEPVLLGLPVHPK